MIRMEVWFDEVEETRPSFSEEEMQLFRAASSGSREAVLGWLTKGVSAEVLINGFNALHIAAKKNRESVVDVILEHDCVLALSKTEDCRTALMIAAYEGHLETSRVLARVPKLCDEMDRDGNTALHYCVWGGKEDVTRFLLDECQADPTRPNREGVLPIQLASASNNLRLFLLLSGADAGSSGGLNSLHRACMYGSLDIVRHMIAETPSLIASTTASGSSPLHLAAKGGFLPVVECLLQSEAVVDVKDSFALTPLHLACIG
jgi:ankyrin repeat protein